MRVADQRRYVVDGSASNLVALVADDEEAPIQRQITSIAGNLDDATDHVIPGNQDR